MKIDMNDIKTIKERIPVWALCYIEYGDKDTVTDEEVQMIDNFYESYRKRGMEIRSIYPICDDDENLGAYFTHSPAFGLPCDVVDCDVFYTE